MILYKKNNIEISTIEEQDKDIILDYYSNNTFNCDFETGSLRPSDSEFIQIMDDIINGDDESQILVLKKNNKVIGYISVYVEYDQMVLGHIAIDEKEQHQGYGKLLTELAILLAENDNRNVSLYCNYPNRYLSNLGFDTYDGIHYLYKRKGMKTDLLPHLFVSVDEYRVRADEIIKMEVNSFGEFLRRSKKNGLLF
jgi:N-acetylglutamate synthase-like GNAT family acetyltransferase